MTDHSSVDRLAGVVLVGGKSSRMGRNKALLPYLGRPLYRHMEALLRSCGLAHVFFSGQVEDTPNCIIEPEAHEGPARALLHVMQELHQQFDRLLVVPVDMPLLTPALLQRLVRGTGASHFHQHPLPAVLTCRTTVTEARSIYALLEAQHATALPLPENAAACMQNINTPEDWALLQKVHD